MFDQYFDIARLLIAIIVIILILSTILQGFALYSMWKPEKRHPRNHSPSQTTIRNGVGEKINKRKDNMQ